MFSEKNILSLKFEVHIFSLKCALGRRRDWCVSSQEAPASDLIMDMMAFKLFQMSLKRVIICENIKILQNVPSLLTREFKMKVLHSSP